jgi:hypothetical protein
MNAAEILRALFWRLGVGRIGTPPRNGLDDLVARMYGGRVPNPRAGDEDDA